MKFYIFFVIIMFHCMIFYGSFYKFMISLQNMMIEFRGTIQEDMFLLNQDQEPKTECRVNEDGIIKYENLWKMMLT